MPRPKKQLMSYDAILETMKDGLKQQATRPNLLAYVPHDKQAEFHKATEKVVLYIGGNRSGKTVGGAVESIYRLMGRHPFKKVPESPIRGRAVAVDFTYGVDAIILPEIARWIPPSFLKNGSWEDSYDTYHRTLTLANKSFLEFKSYDQDLEKFAGTSRHFTWYDEEPPKHIYNECQARLVDTDGDAFLTMTPVEGMSWVFDDIYNIADEDENIKVIEIEMTENPYIGKEAAERYLRTLDPEERKARERGEFVAMGGRIFKQFSPSVHVIPACVPDRSWEWYSSFDHGYNNPTAILWHAVSPDNHIITFAESYKREVTVDVHAADWHLRNTGFNRVPDITVGDPAMSQRNGVTGTSITQEYADRGVYIAPGNNDVDSGINRMIQYLNNDRWHVTENCINLIGEMKKLRWATFSSRKMQYHNNKQEKIHKKDDHACDSARYFFSLMPDLTPPNYGPSVPKTVGVHLKAGYGAQVAGSWDDILAAQNGHVTPNTEWTLHQGSELQAMEY